VWKHAVPEGQSVSEGTQRRAQLNELCKNYDGTKRTKLNRLIRNLITKAGADRGKVQSGNAGGDDRYDPIARELFHEQIPQIGIHRIQRKT
jgi:hypothetical protein